jgi:hypothetical protein
MRCGFEKEGEFPERIRLAKGKGSASAFALRCGLSPTVMHQYLTGKSEPTRPALIAMARAAGVNLEWLLTGNGPMEKIKARALIDMEFYDSVIQVVDEYLDGKKSLPVGKKIETFHYFCDLFKDRQEFNKEQVGKALQLLL